MLRAAGVIDGYRLTEVGLALAPVVRELARWAITTDSAALSEGHLDTAALTWDMRRRVDAAALPARQVVLAIEFTDRPTSDRRFWLHLSRTGVDLCRDDTGAPVDLWLTTPTRAATEWWLGNLSWQQLLQQPGVQIHGDHALQRDLPHWFTRYLFTPENLGMTTA